MSWERSSGPPPRWGLWRVGNINHDNISRAALAVFPICTSPICHVDPALAAQQDHAIRLLVVFSFPSRPSSKVYPGRGNRLPILFLVDWGPTCAHRGEGLFSLILPLLSWWQGIQLILISLRSILGMWYRELLGGTHYQEQDVMVIKI